MIENEIVDEIFSRLKFKSSILYEFCQEMVEPLFSESIKTACVVFDQEDKDKNIQFLFNRAFWNSLNANEKLFVFIHETLHVLFFHGSRGYEFMESLPEKERNHKTLNAAMDICINEIIKNEYLPYPNSAFPVLGDMMCDIENCFGAESRQILPRKNFIYYYHELMKRGLETSGFDEHVFLENGNAPSNELEQKIQEVLQDKKSDVNIDKLEDDLLVGGGYSNSTCVPKESKQISIPSNPKKKLEYYLDEFLASKFGGSIPKPKIYRKWYGVNRRTHMVSTGLILPKIEEVKKKKGKNRIIAYCDVSGSVSRVSKVFLDLLAGLSEDKYDVDMYVFGDYVKAAKKNPNGSITYSGAGGGTSIESVLKHHKQLTEEHDVVIVLTDGQYSYLRNNAEDKYDNWYFFMTRMSKNAPVFSKKINIL